MTIIILLILTGILLLILEFFIFPGVTIAGIGGALMIAAGIIIAYTTHGSPTGHIVLLLTILTTLVVITLALRSKTWNKLKLETEITAAIETIPQDLVKAGDKGFTISRLNPIGKARINNQDVEAHCPGSYIDPKTEIEVIKVHKTHVIVKPIKQI